MPRDRLHRLGQHFTTCSKLLRDVASRIRGRGVVLEVGVGCGALTRRVAGHVKYLVGLEVDELLSPCLRALQDSSLADLVVADALHPPVRLVAFDVVFGSIPYSITGPLLVLLARRARGDAVLVLQKEVADRLASGPGERSYGRITVIVRSVYRVRLGPIYPPSCFKPRPRVASRLVLLERTRTLDDRLFECLERLARCMFSQRRKLASRVAEKCIGSRLEGLEGRRVYQLSVEEFLELAEKACLEDRV
ncbi:MAG: ribosomal RNA small subunit methyltransferase A [Crenarchaeota archaeon]|nr:ribosomal RNA small subunit methyltransferase A [Thermoproteota archaeon]